MTRQDEVFQEYAPYLATTIWPSVEKGYTGEKYTPVEEMVPQYAAAALAKLIRWAKYAPSGDITMHADEDSREEAVRKSRLGMALAARATNMTEEHFHAMYGEYGVGSEALIHDVMATVIQTLHDKGLADWQAKDLAVLSWHIAEALDNTFVITERPGRA